MILSLLFLALLVLVLGFLAAPVKLYVDTDENRYELSHWPVLFFSISFYDYGIIPYLRLVGVKFKLTSIGKSKVDRKPKQKKSKPRFSKSFPSWRFLISRILRSFIVQDLTMDIDTGDVATNAKLVPLTLLANGRVVHLSTNFQGRVYLHLEACNRFGKLAWIFIQFLTKK
jgi:hypothetical protein